MLSHTFKLKDLLTQLNVENTICNKYSLTCQEIRCSCYYV